MKTIIDKITDYHSYFNGLDTLENGYAWLALGALLTLERLLTKKMDVLEFGCGGSTIFFADRCNSVKSLETDSKWQNMVNKKLGEDGYKNACVFYNSEEDTIKALSSPTQVHEVYDVILVDSGWVRDEKENKRNPNRRKLFELSIPYLKTGGMLIIDNYQHYGMRNFNYEGFEVYTFDDIGYSGRGTKICVKL